MAQRGRPRKKAKVEDAPEVEVEEAQMEDTTVSEPSAEKANDFVKESLQPKDDMYDLNSSSESKLGSSYNPFGESVEEKAYRTPQMASAESISEIEEPAFVRPTYDDLVTANEGVTQNGEDGEQPQEEKKGFDRFSQDEIKELPKEDKAAAAEGLSQVMLGIYSFGCTQLGGLSKISDKKLKGLEDEGLLDTTMRVPIDRHTTASVRQIVDSMNTQADEAFEVTDDFKEKALPVMTSVFQKRGWGVTEEQNLLIMFGMDIAQKVTIVAQMRSAANYQLEAFMKMHSAQQSSSRPVDFATPEGEVPKPKDTTPQASQVVEEEQKVSTNAKAESNMVASDNPDLKVSKSDLAQVDVDNV